MLTRAKAIMITNRKEHRRQQRRDATSRTVADAATEMAYKMVVDRAREQQ